MTDLRNLVSRETYSDAPHFSDELLLPALTSGHAVTLVTAFVPSYVFRLVKDLASTKEIEPGKLHVIFCIPFALTEGTTPARIVSKYLSAYAADSKEVKEFLEGLLQLDREGGATFSALVSTASRLLTPSCVGTIESGVLGSNDYLSLIDALAGDYNSPIEISTSWSNRSQSLHDIASLTVRAKSENFNGLIRVGHTDLKAILTEILKRGYPKKDIEERDGVIEKPKRKRSSSPGKLKKSKIVDDADDEVDDFEDMDDLEDLGDSTEFWIRRIIWEVNARERNSALMVDDFLGETIPQSELYGDDVDETSHIPPLVNGLEDLVGYGYSSCWCGEVFDRAMGCPNWPN